MTSLYHVLSLHRKSELIRAGMLNPAPITDDEKLYDAFIDNYEAEILKRTTDFPSRRLYWDSLGSSKFRLLHKKHYVVDEDWGTFRFVRALRAQGAEPQLTESDALLNETNKIRRSWQQGHIDGKKFQTLYRTNMLHRDLYIRNRIESTMTSEDGIFIIGAAHFVPVIPGIEIVRLYESEQLFANLQSSSVFGSKIAHEMLKTNSIKKRFLELSQKYKDQLASS